MSKPFIYQEPQADKYAFMKRGDAWAVSEDGNILAVADSPLRRLTIHKRDYPIDDLGGGFAQIFCDQFIENAERQESLDANIIRKILTDINQQIRSENLSRGKTYGDPNNYDMGETVGAGVVIKGDNLFFGLLEDCYVNVLRGAELVDQVKLDYQIVKASKEIDRIGGLGKLVDYMTPELIELMPDGGGDRWEPMWCNFLRNKPEATNDVGEKVGWGIFNGEPEAEQFFQVGHVKLHPGDHILVFSDGMIPVLEDRDTLKWLLENASTKFKMHLEFRKRIMELLKDKPTLHKEKTLIYRKWQG